MNGVIPTLCFCRVFCLLGGEWSWLRRDKIRSGGTTKEAVAIAQERDRRVLEL